MENEEDSSVVRPTLKLSRCSRKSRKRPPQSAADSDTKPAATKRKRPRKLKKENIPIPSFSPIHNIEELDTSVLDSPVKQEEKPINLLQDDDDDDDALLMGPPTFPSAEPCQATTVKKSNITKEKRVSVKKAPARPVSKSEETTRPKSDDAKLAADKLPDETVTAIETLLAQVDTSKVTLKEMVKRVSTEHGYDGNKAMQKLIRGRIKSLMRSSGNDDDDEADDTCTDSVAERSNKANVTAAEAASKESVTTTATARGEKPPTVKPDEDALIMSIDNLFAQADAKTATVREFHMALEGEYGARLHKTCRAFVKARLKGLFDGTIEPTVSPIVESSSEDTCALFEEAANLKRDDSSILFDDDDDMTINDDDDDCAPPVMDSVQVKQPAPSVAERIEVKPKAKRRGRPPKKAQENEVIDIASDSMSTTKPAARKQPVEKAAAKPKKKAAAPKKPRAPRAKKGTCALCTTCSCTTGRDTNAKDTPAVNMSRTDAEIERALIRRTKKMEGIVDKYQGMLDQVNRELKKHRRAVWKKQEAQVNGRQLAFGDSRFLPDAEVWDEQAEAVQLEALSPTVVEEAKGTLFGTGNCQVTLTQMFGGGSKEKDENTEENIEAVDSNDEKDQCSQTVTDEDKEEPQDGDDSVVDSSELDEEPEEAPVGHIHRVSWRKGTKVEGQSPFLRGSGAWSALTTAKTEESSLVDIKSSPQLVSSPSQEAATSLLSPPNDDSKYNCAWDALFSNDAADDDDQMDQLLGLFEEDISDESEEASTSNAESCSQQSAFETALLTQRGESVADTIEEEITSDPIRLQSIEAVCPNWRENIRYALAQRGPGEIRLALERVQRSMTNLQSTKEKVSTVWKRQEVVLQLFEMSLSASLSRLSPDESPDSQSRNGIDDEQVVLAQALQAKEPTALSPIMEGDETFTQPSQ